MPLSFIPSDWLTNLSYRDPRTLYVTITAPLLAYFGFRTLYTIFSSSYPAEQQPKIYAAPRQALQVLSAQDLSKSPYPPDALPGARDVETPYGNIRVYEWGPENGRKVLCVHGITTPCIAYAGIAKRLVEEHGCRVMLFDLFGRGYSDAPDPEVYHQDIRLFTTQILLVLASSELNWTGSGERFTLIGYSLGGGISAAFTFYFPRLVGSLVLIAPAGLIRLQHISLASKIVYGHILPPTLIYYLAQRRLMAGPTHMAPKNDGSKATVSDAATAEMPAAEPSHPAHAEHSTAPLFPGRPNASPFQAVSWLAKVHPGFPPSFVSSLKNAPVTAQHSRWTVIGKRQAAFRAAPASAAAKAEALREGKVLILLGVADKVILVDEIEEDAKATLGAENVEVVRLNGAHDVPIVNAEGCVKNMVRFWAEGGVAEAVTNKTQLDE